VKPTNGLTTAGWGGPADMTDWEAVMWRAEVEPRTRSTGVLLEILDCEPDWNRLVAAHDRITRQIPRLRERVVEPALPLVPPAWSPDHDFDLRHHLHRLRLPAPGGMRELLEVTEGLFDRPLDRSRPPWEAILFEGLDGGRAAYALKLHHSLTDGQGGIQLLELAHSRTREASHTSAPAAPPQPPEPQAAGPGRRPPRAIAATTAASLWNAARRAAASRAHCDARHDQHLRVDHQGNDGGADHRAGRISCRAADRSGCSPLPPSTVLRSSPARTGRATGWSSTTFPWPTSKRRGRPPAGR